MSIDTRAFRDSLGCFATGVTIVTSVDLEGKPIGITANSFNSVSLEPPMVLFSLHKKAYSLPGFEDHGHFAVNLLRQEQEELSNRFARALSDKWTGVEYETWESGCPILADALASFDCVTRFRYDGGDHVIFVGEVRRLEVRSGPDDPPLMFYRGSYRRFSLD